MRASRSLVWLGAAVVLLPGPAAGQPNSRTTEAETPQSTFDSIFSALSNKATQLVDKARNTFSGALLPGHTEEIYTDLTNRNSPVEENRSLFGNFYNKMAHMLPSKGQTKRSLPKKMSPVLAAQLEGLWRESQGFREPDMLQITQASLKRSAQQSGYNYLPPGNPLELPREKKSQSDQLDFVNLIQNNESPTTRRFPGRLVTASNNKFQEILPETFDESYDDSEVSSLAATPRSFNTRRGQGGQGGRRKQEQLVQLEAVTINSTPGSFRIIQPIQIVSTVSPPRNQRKNQKLQKKSQRFQQQKSSRQVAGKPIEGFPNGLPDFTPKGVRITLENMIGPDGEMVMNPIPGEAGTDYPVFTEVPDTGFNCGQQEFLPGIYTDTGADCQSFFMCEENGRSTGFLCPNGTIFNQQYFVCDWWYNIDCASQPDFYSLNQFIYDSPEEGASDSDYY